MNTKIYICTITLAVTLFSCDRITRKGQTVVDTTIEKISDKKNEAIDQVIPTFDSDKPDTKFNKKRFRAFFGFEPTPDVQRIYCFGDQIGIDSKFMFSFQCSTATKTKIVAHLDLTKSEKTDNSSSGLWQKFTWWDSLKIVTINPYWSKTEHEHYRYLWFDSTKQMIYFIDFDL